MAKVVIHYDDACDVPTIYVEGDVEVLSVCEHAPDDRIYRFQNKPIPDGLLDGPVGHLNDGSSANARIHKAIKEYNGEAPFTVIDGGASDN